MLNTLYIHDQQSTINNLRYVHMQCRDDFYTSICNYLDYTASVFPVTLVDKARDRPASPHAFRNHEDEAVYKMCACLHLSSFTSHSVDLPGLDPLGLHADERSAADDPELFDGLPVGLQLIGRTLEEEGVIAMTEVVVAALQEFGGR